MLSIRSRVRITPGAPKTMKILRKILIAVLVILILLFSAAYLFFIVKGKTVLTQKLEDALKSKISIGNLGIKIPLVLEIKDLSIGKLAKVDWIYVSPNLTALLGGKIVLNEVKFLRPEINWERRSPVPDASEKNLTDLNIEEALAQIKEILNSPKAKSKQKPQITIKYLGIKDGIVNFTDRAVSGAGIQIILKEVLVDVDNLYLFSKSSVPVTDFQLTAKIPWQKGASEGTVYASGEINLYKKDIQARLEVEGINGIALRPYYAEWVDLEKSRIEEARLNFISDIQGQNNEVVAKCRLELTDIKFKPRPAEQAEHKAEKIATMILGIFRALNQGKVVVNFTIRTKLDRPEFKFDRITSAVEKTITEAIESDKIKIKDVALFPGRLIGGVAKGTTDTTKAIIGGTLSAGKSLTGTILEVLKTEEEPEAQQESILGE